VAGISRGIVGLRRISRFLQKRRGRGRVDGEWCGGMAGMDEVVLDFLLWLFSDFFPTLLSLLSREWEMEIAYRKTAYGCVLGRRTDRMDGVGFCG